MKKKRVCKRVFTYVNLKVAVCFLAYTVGSLARTLSLQCTNTYLEEDAKGGKILSLYHLLYQSILSEWFVSQVPEDDEAYFDVDANEIASIVQEYRSLLSK